MQDIFKFDTPETLPIQTQATEVISTDLAWLAGIIDGEGNLQASVQAKKCGSDGLRRNYFEPKIRITNTDVRMIKRISEIYAQIGLVFFYALNDVKRYKNRKATWHNQLEITVGSKIQITKLLQLVLPYLVHKRRYAELMQETINWVQAQPRRGRHSAGINYTEREEFWQFIDAMKAERDFHIEPAATHREANSVLHW